MGASRAPSIGSDAENKFEKKLFLDCSPSHFFHGKLTSNALILSFAVLYEGFPQSSESILCLILVVVTERKNVHVYIWTFPFPPPKNSQ